MEKGELAGKLSAELASLLAPGATIKAGSHLAKLTANTRFSAKLANAINQGAKEAGIAHKGVWKSWKTHPEKGSFGSKGSKLSDNFNSIPRYEGPKPNYHVNPAHVPGSRGFNPKKTPLPKDAESVFKNAVPNDPKNPTAWFGKNSEGKIYRYSMSNDGTTHFSGIDGIGDGIKNLTPYARKRLNNE